ncbi:T9SS type A sorting domain-containing protein [uncultured Dokdonia sp.]|uniref:T9SS type A sorting domain-containing protein n=1 Tax=uncultured Dokdonia sp. TaxID=575653 RepID=UPI002602560C|nr:T9SS type A sorting domain-containing protein [uncultured Dokdonia sp.]
MKQILRLLVFIPFVTFAQVAQIGEDIDGSVAQEFFGIATSISSDGDFIVVGALGATNTNGDVFAGAARIYENISGEWTQISADIEGGQVGETFGGDVVISGDGTIVAVAGAEYDVDPSSNSGEGRVRVFENQSGIWVQIGEDIIGDDPGAFLGNHIDMSDDGTIVSVGAIFNDEVAPNAGQIEVFENQSGAWVQIGQSINGLAENDRTTNHALTADGSRIVVTSFGNEGDDRGRLRVFDYNTTTDTWDQVGQDVLGTESQEQLGSGGLSISDDGTVIGIGIPNAPITNAPGLARFYDFDTTTEEWNQIGEDILGDVPLGQLGNGTGLDLSPNGSFAVIGTAGAFLDPDTNDFSGNFARVYENQSGEWVQVGPNLQGEVFGDLFGWTLSLSDNGIVVVGGFQNEDGGGVNAGHVRVFDINDAFLSTEEFVVTKVSLYPNPTSNVFTVQLSNSVTLENIQIYNSLGQQVSAIINQNNVNVSALKQGIYFVEITTNQGITSEKIIIQ